MVRNKEADQALSKIISETHEAEDRKTREAQAIAFLDNKLYILLQKYGKQEPTGLEDFRFVTPEIIIPTSSGDIPLKISERYEVVIPSEFRTGKFPVVSDGLEIISGNRNIFVIDRDKNAINWKDEKASLEDTQLIIHSLLPAMEEAYAKLHKPKPILHTPPHSEDITGLLPPQSPRTSRMFP